MNATDTAAATTTAERIARHYASRVRHADYDDCYQEAWLAILISYPSYDRERGPFAPWAARVAARSVRAHLYAQRSPVSGPRSRTAEALAGISPVVLDTLAHALHDGSPSASEALAQARAAHAITSAVLAVTDGMDPLRRSASRAVLLDGLAPREAAAEVGLPADSVGWAVRRARGDVKARYGSALRPHL